MEKQPFDLQKEQWHPSVLPGQIVLVSTVNAAGEVNLAPKSWITMVAATCPTLAFGCNLDHATYVNAATTGQFVVNIPGEPLVERVWSLLRSHSADRVRASGFSLVPARRVRPPLIDECVAHLECELDSVKAVGKEVLLFGRIVAASIARHCQERASAPEQYFALRPIFFLENSTYGSIDTAKHVGTPSPTEQRLFVVEVGQPGGRMGEGALVQRHCAFLKRLQRAGVLLMAGEFADSPATEVLSSDDRGGGLYVIGARSQVAAEALARRDPLVRAGAPLHVRLWRRTF